MSATHDSAMVAAIDELESLLEEAMAQEKLARSKLKKTSKSKETKTGFLCLPSFRICCTDQDESAKPGLLSSVDAYMKEEEPKKKKKTPAAAPDATAELSQQIQDLRAVVARYRHLNDQLDNDSKTREPPSSGGFASTNVSPTSVATSRSQDPEAIGEYAGVCGRRRTAKEEEKKCHLHNEPHHGHALLEEEQARQRVESLRLAAGHGSLAKAPPVLTTPESPKMEVATAGRPESPVALCF